MSSLNDLKAAQKALAEQQRIVADLNALVADIERCQKTVEAIDADLQQANSKYQGQRTTREDVEYLSALLDCAKRKLAWEKQIASVQKRAPEVLGRLQHQMDDPKNPPAEELREQMVRALQGLQAAMERLQSAKLQ